jgi:S1-C subfamily serine protease
MLAMVIRKFSQYTLGVVLFALAGFLAVLWAQRREGYGLDDLIAGKPVETGENYTPATESAVKPSDVSLLEQLNEENTKLIESVAPAVVSINTTKVVSQRFLSMDFFNGPQWRQQQIQQAGLGSGVIVSMEGHVITNAHVVEGVAEIQITTNNGKKYLATKIGEDQDTDIAVLKINDPKYTTHPALKFADSDMVKVGEMVWAIGNPFGLRESVTRGIISHRDRQLGDSDTPKLQTDAVINPGNSGGPLVNVRGEIVGINVAIYTGDQDRGKSWIGYAFSIPANEVQRAFRRIMKGGNKDTIGYLGLRAEIDSSRPGESVPVTVIEVTPGAPADKAGLKPGDIIQKFDNRAINNERELYERINRTPVGEDISIIIERDGQNLTLKARVADRQNSLSEDERAAERRDLRDQIGIEVQNLSSMSRSRRNLPEDIGGILVSDIQARSPADGLIMKGDIIYQVDKTPIDSVEKFFSVISTLKGKTFPMKIIRRGFGYTLKITLD